MQHGNPLDFTLTFSVGGQARSRGGVRVVRSNPPLREVYAAHAHIQRYKVHTGTHEEYGRAKEEF